MDRDEGDEMLPLLVLLGTIAGAWYLLIMRPQKELQTRHGRLVEQLQVGDHVLTVGGIYGRVAAIEGASVVLELAPGLTSRIATDGIARIVHGGEGALPMASTGGAGILNAAPNSPPVLDTSMHQQPHADHPQQHSGAAHQQPVFVAPTYVAPATPYAAPQAPVPVQYAAPHFASQGPAQMHAPAPAQVSYAAPVGSSIPTFEPRPWGDVAPVNMPQQAAPRLHHHVQPPQAQFHAHAQIHAPLPAQAPAPAQAFAPQPMPVLQPFAPHDARQVAYAPAPMHAPAPAMAPTQPALVMAAPMVSTQAPIPVHAAPTAHPAGHGVEATLDPDPTERVRRHSRAPQGMGSNLRLDDPSLSDTMNRARQERAGLAEEYRKLVAPLVDVGTEHPHQHAPQPLPQTQALAPGHAPQLVGHDPNGVPLYASPGAPMAHPIAQFPMPAQVAPAHGVPRPVFTAPVGDVEPAFTSNAFQRRTPYAPDPALHPAHQHQSLQHQQDAVAPAHA